MISVFAASSLVLRALSAFSATFLAVKVDEYRSTITKFAEQKLFRKMLFDLSRIARARGSRSIAGSNPGFGQIDARLVGQSDCHMALSQLSLQLHDKLIDNPQDRIFL